MSHRTRSPASGKRHQGWVGWVIAGPGNGNDNAGDCAFGTWGTCKRSGDSGTGPPTAGYRDCRDVKIAAPWLYQIDGDDCARTRNGG